MCLIICTDREGGYGINMVVYVLLARISVICTNIITVTLCLSNKVRSILLCFLFMD